MGGWESERDEVGSRTPADYSVCRVAACFTCSGGRSRDAWLARECAADGRHHGFQRRDQYSDAVWLTLYVAGLRSGDSEPQHSDLARPLADGAVRLRRAGLL